MFKTKKRWTVNELEILEKYVATHAQQLIGSLYKNILVGHIRFPKPYGFFTRLSSALQRSRAQCKAKFCQMEAELYIEVLSVSSPDFCLFAGIRQQKLDAESHRDRSQSQGGIDILSRKGENGSLPELSDENRQPRADENDPQSAIQQGTLRRMSHEDIT